MKTITTFSAAFLLAACGMTSTVEVPKKLEPAADEAPTLVARARGVQIYECRTKAGSTDMEWAFVAPEAYLLDTRGRVIGHHGAGPVWEMDDGSVVRGKVKERADAPIAGAIPWLLLTAKSEGTIGEISRVTSIQRVNTVGGVAPTGGCDKSRVGTPIRVAYTADYVFFAR
jgi:hypothetical protein